MLLYCLLVFGLSWAVWVPMAVQGVIVRVGTLPTHFAGLLGPLVAAWLTLWLLPGRGGARRDFGRRLFTPPTGWRGWGLALVPGVVIAAILLIAPVADLSGIARFSGLPILSLPLLFLIVLLVNGYGEESGWRGFLLPRLQRRFGATRGVLVQAGLWIAWHAPLFWIVATYRAMPVAMILFGFGLGLVLGAFVLAQVTAESRGSVMAAAIWHTLYNFGTATDLGGIVQSGLSAVVMTWGGVLLVRALFVRGGADAIRVPPPSTKAGARPR